MRKLSSLVIVALLTVAGSARAQEEAPAAAPAGDPAAAADPAVAPAPAPAPAATGLGLIIGVDAAFQLPLGDYADFTGMGFGGLIRGEYKLMPNLNLTFRTGYLYSLKKDLAADLGKNAIDIIPIWVGGKFFINDMIYAGAEVGANMLRSRSEVSFLGNTESSTSSETKVGADVGVGALLGDLDVRAQFEILNFSEAKKSMAVMINVGYNFLKL
jgi:hypothetical protein